MTLETPSTQTLPAELNMSNASQAQPLPAELNMSNASQAQLLPVQLNDPRRMRSLTMDFHTTLLMEALVSH